MYFPQVDINQWHHISVTYDGNNLIGYLNAEEIASQSGSFSINYDNSPLYIGHAGYGSEYFNGAIDDFTIWDTVLSHEDIQEIMHGDLNGGETGLIGFWKFNSGEGNNLYDHSGNQNHGTIYGADWILSGCTDPYLSLIHI